jgi:uncharacterized protein (DUF2249 family)
MEQVIDVSKLPPPEPMERILDALADLAEGDWLRVRHRRDPIPLYRMLRDMGYRWDTSCLAPDRFEILIWPKEMPRPDGSLGQTS